MSRRKRKATVLDDDDDTPSTADEVIIALDFGTTYSGVAYCFTHHHDPKPVSILDWPGSGGISMPKIPTVISYNKGDLRDYQWGIEAEKATDAIVGIKLLLDPTQQRPTYLSSSDSSQRTLASLPKPPVEIAGDIMRGLYKHALAEICKSVPDGYVDMCSKKFVLTVPAVWSDAAKHATEKAAKLAGIHPVTLIKEPEAAALFATQSMKFALRPGDAFVVCDAGGGTVDLISYEVESIYPTLCVKELVPGTGGMSGSLGLNVRFEDAVQSLVGQEQWQRLQGTRGWNKARMTFDRDVKRAFDGKGKFYVEFPMANLRDDLKRGLMRDSWELTEQELTPIFEPLINDIIRLIEEQVAKSTSKRSGKLVTGILLVGGFGSNQYLQQQVTKHFPRIKVIQPNDAWAAIVKGAVISKLPRQATVTSMCATRHYGVEAWHVYDSKIDRGQASRVDRAGKLEVERMTWYIHKGQDLRRDQKIKFPFFREVDEDYEPEDLIFESALFQCEDRQAPPHRAASSNVAANCTISCDLSSASKSDFKKRRDTQRELYGIAELPLFTDHPLANQMLYFSSYEVYYDLVVTIRSAVMTFSVEFNGRTMGSVEAKFD